MLDFRNKVLINNFSFITILKFSNYLIPLLTLPYLLRILGPEKFGLMNFASAFSMYFGIFIDYGFNLLVPREVSIHRNDKNKLTEILSSVLIIRGSLFFISTIIFFLLVFLIPKFNNNRDVYLLSFMAIFGQVISPSWFFQGFEKMYFITITTIAIRISSVCSIFSFISTPQDLSLLIIINGLVIITISTISLLKIIISFSLQPRLQSISTLCFYMKEGSHLFVSSVSISFYTISNTFILGLIAGDLFVGYYSVADKIRQAVQNLFSAISEAIFPHLAKIFTTSIPSGLSFIKKIFKTAGLLNLVICVFIFVFSEEVIFVVCGPGYTNSVLILRILAVLPFVIFISNLAGIQIMINLGYMNIFLNIILTAAFISMMLTFILVPLYKDVGTAISALITEFFVSISMIMFLKNKLRLPTRLEIKK